MAERKSYLLRIDPAVWAEIEAWARDELRSVNGQVEYLLRQAVLKWRGARRMGPPLAGGESDPPPRSGGA